MAQRDTPFADPQARTVAGKMGLRIFLASLSMLFAASVIGYAWIRLLALGTPVELPPLPAGLWLSTLLLLSSSGTMQMAVAAARRGAGPRLTAAMTATAALGFGFLAVQAWCWLAWLGPMRASLGEAERLFLLTAFYVLTGLHALHVIGGLVPMTIVAARAHAGRYSPRQHAGVVYVAMYWHFLDGVWLVLFGTLLVGSIVSH